MPGADDFEESEQFAPPMERGEEIVPGDLSGRTPFDPRAVDPRIVDDESNLIVGYAEIAENNAKVPDHRL
jgi:hypothetical protein